VNSLDRAALLCNHHYMTTTEKIDPTAWLIGRLPEDWTAAGEPQVTVDREEVTVLVALTAPDLTEDASETDRAQAREGRVQRWREETRQARMGIAREAEHRFGRKLAWGVRIDDTTELFTHLAVPVMTRLRQPERQVLDTLVDAGVARSRSHALAWCVRLVGEHTDTWLSDLGQAMEQVREVRQRGPRP
jgi:hypothetical protein